MSPYECIVAIILRKFHIFTDVFGIFQMLYNILYHWKYHEERLKKIFGILGNFFHVYLKHIKPFERSSLIAAIIEGELICLGGKNK